MKNRQSMKRVSLLLLALCSFTFSFAQISGQWKGNGRIERTHYRG